jgi:NADH-quinone oxidoreductase subunit K
VTSLLFLKNRNILICLLSLELLFFSLGIGFIAYSAFSLNYEGCIYAAVLLAVSAGESAVGLSLVMLMYKTSGTIQLNEFSTVKY